MNKKKIIVIILAFLLILLCLFFGIKQNKTEKTYIQEENMVQIQDLQEEVATDKTVDEAVQQPVKPKKVIKNKPIIKKIQKTNNIDSKIDEEALREKVELEELLRKEPISQEVIVDKEYKVKSASKYIFK